MLGITIKSFFEQCKCLSKTRVLIDDLEYSIEDIMTNLNDNTHYRISLCSELRKIERDLDSELMKELEISKDTLYPITTIEIRRL